MTMHYLMPCVCCVQIVDVSNMSSLYGGPMSGTGKVFVIVHGYKSSARVTWADVCVFIFRLQCSYLRSVINYL